MRVLWRSVACGMLVLVLAERDSVAMVQELHADKRGEAAFAVGDAADWESTWASLTFARPVHAAPAPR